jgi:hypothetical protein
MEKEHKYVVLEHLTLPDRGKRFWTSASENNTHGHTGELWYKEILFTNDEEEAIRVSQEYNEAAYPTDAEMEEHIAEKVSSRVRVLQKADSLAEFVKTKAQADGFMTDMRALEFRLETDDSGGYHNVKIPKEEFLELWDAHSQRNPVMMICEMCDIIGAIEALAGKYNLTLEDLVQMMRATQRAFKNGRR